MRKYGFVDMSLSTPCSGAAAEAVEHHHHQQKPKYIKKSTEANELEEGWKMEFFFFF